jgi:hypothetical protein
MMILRHAYSTFTKAGESYSWRCLSYNRNNQPDLIQKEYVDFFNQPSGRFYQPFQTPTISLLKNRRRLSNEASEQQDS